MHFKLAQFDLHDNTYSQEVSMLQVRQIYGMLPSGQIGITIDGAEFMFAGDDRDNTGEDIYGWNFRPTMSAVQKNPVFANKRVLIVND